MTPAEVIRLRRALLLTREGLGRLSGYKVRQLAAFENGEVDIPRRAELAFMAVLVGLRGYDPGQVRAVEEQHGLDRAGEALASATR